MTDTAIIRAHWAVEFEEDEVGRFWSGTGDITLDGMTYAGITVNSANHGIVSLMQISSVETNLGDPDRRARIAFAFMDEDLRALLSVDRGTVPVNIHWISQRPDASWQKLPGSYRGRLSSASITGNVYTAELETWLGDIDRGIPVVWSTEAQKERYPGDLGLDFVRGLSDGFETRWPP